jgi:hypothetical protein
VERGVTHCVHAPKSEDVALCKLKLPVGHIEPVAVSSEMYVGYHLLCTALRMPCMICTYKYEPLIVCPVYRCAPALPRLPYNTYAPAVLSRVPCTGVRRRALIHGFIRRRALIHGFMRRRALIHGFIRDTHIPHSPHPSTPPHPSLSSPSDSRRQAPTLAR